MSKEKDFRDSLSALPNEQPRPSFPADEDVLGKMDPKNKMYSFDMEDIDKKIKISKLTKARRATIFIS